VEVVDVGIRGVHLAYDLLDGCDLLVLVDAAPLGRPPGTVTVLELDGERPGSTGGQPGPPATVEADAHAMTPQAVLALVRALGGQIGRTMLVACEPGDLSEGIGLSDAVAPAVDAAVAAVRRIVADAVARVSP
jgi:hydrogenase maturation protease